MKKLILAIGCASILTSPLALAQAGDRPPRASLQERLDLTDEQMEEIRKIRAEGGGKEAFLEVLTPEQREKAEAHRAERRQAFTERRLKGMQRRLDLSDEQVEQIRQIRQQGGGREEINAVLTEEQLEKAKELRQAHGGEKRF